MQVGAAGDRDDVELHQLRQGVASSTLGAKSASYSPGDPESDGGLGRVARLIGYRLATNRREPEVAEGSAVPNFLAGAATYVVAQDRIELSTP